MKLSTSDLKTDRHWRSATGLDQPRFLKLLVLLPAAYKQLFGLSIQQRQAECPDQPALNNYEDLLLFTLFSLKSNLSAPAARLRFAGLHHWYGRLDGQAESDPGTASYGSGFVGIRPYPQTRL